MNYLAYYFWNHMISISEERRIIDGKEEVCLVIPTKTNQIKKGKQGNWMSIFRLAECSPNARMQTHDLQLTYLSEEEVQKSYDFGYHKRTAHLGRVYEHDRTPEKKIDRTNHATDIRLDGVIELSDIPKDLIFANAENAKKYLSNVAFKATPDNGIVFVGSICLSDIPMNDIQQDPNTGKKYIHTTLLKMPNFDTYENTHKLVIMRNNEPTEIEIGRFKEFRAQNFVPPSPQQGDDAHPTKVNQRPESINGIKF